MIKESLYELCRRNERAEMSLKHRKTVTMISVAAVCVLAAVGALLAGYQIYLEKKQQENSFTTHTYEITESGDLHVSGPVDAHQLASSITKQLKSGETVEIDCKRLESIFGVQGNECKSFSVYLAKKDTSAFEVAVFEFSSAEQKQVLLQAIQRRKAQKLASFRELNQAEYSLVQQAVVAEQDSFLLFAVCRTPQKAQDIFREVLKGS